MKAFFSDNTLVQISTHELKLLRAGAQMQAKFACEMRDQATNYPEIRDSWNEAYDDYSELVTDIDEILKSMPF